MQESGSPSSAPERASNRRILQVVLTPPGTVPSEGIEIVQAMPGEIMPARLAPAATPSVVGRPATSAGFACKMGCGCVSRQGYDRNGVAYETCCSGCGQGQQHDETCAQLAVDILMEADQLGEANMGQVANGQPVYSDAELAYRLQMREMAGTTSPETSRQAPITTAAPHQSDAALAQALQAQEQLRHQVHRGSPAHAPPPASMDPTASDRTVWEAYDPVWGSLQLHAFKGPLAQTRAKLAFEFCPCAIIGCGAKASRAYTRYFLSWAFFLGLLQTFLMIAAIFEDGGLSVQNNIWLGPHFYVLNKLGAKNTALILLRDEWWRLASPIMLHAGIVHLVCNLSMQLTHAIKLEVMFGHTRFIIIYLVSGIYGTMASCVVAPDSLSVGASGALCGLLGAWIVFICITWQQTSPMDIPHRRAESRRVVLSAVFIAGISFLPMLDLGAHVGGLVMGAVVATILFANYLQETRWRILTFAVGLGTFAIIVGATLFLLLERTDPDDDFLYLCKADEDADCPAFQSCFKSCRPAEY